VCVCSLRYPASNAHAPYCRLWPAPLYSIFRHYLINGTIFEKVIEHKMCILISSSDFVWHISHSKKNWARYNQKCLVVFIQCTRYSSQILMKLEFFSTVFRNILRCQILWKSVRWERSCSTRIDGRTDMTKLIIAFRNFVNAPKEKKEIDMSNYCVLFMNIFVSVLFRCSSLWPFSPNLIWTLNLCFGDHTNAVLLNSQ